MHVKRTLHAMVGACLAVAALSADAAIIQTLTTVSLPGGSTGTIGNLGANPAPNNDNAAAASANTIPYTVFHNALGTMEVEFVAANSGGTTEYQITQTFINNTGETWIGFEFELGYGLGDAFTRSGAGDGLDFDTPDADPTPTASLFSVLLHESDFIRWTDGSVPSIGVLTLSFAIDVPDNLAAFNPAGLDRFTLRQSPIVAAQEVPEPSSLLLLGAGALGLVVRRRI